jgi:hypothetical protein
MIENTKRVSKKDKEKKRDVYRKSSIQYGRIFQGRD